MQYYEITISWRMDNPIVLDAIKYERCNMFDHQIFWYFYEDLGEIFQNSP